MSGGLRIAGAASAAAVLAATAGGVAYFEGVIPHTYRDPVGIPTACAGETGPHIVMGQTYTLDQCMAMLDSSLARHWRGLESCADAELTINQAAALLSWTFNVGAGAACRSTLVRMLNSGAPAELWCHQLTRWTYATKLGIKLQLPGLVKRRASELSMCLHGVWDIPALDREPVPEPAPPRTTVACTRARAGEMPT